MHQVELGNEMYDLTVPEIKTLFPTATEYAKYIAPWFSAIQAAFPQAQIALCGSYDSAWLAELLATPVGKAAHHITVHVRVDQSSRGPCPCCARLRMGCKQVYTGLPNGPYLTPDEYRAVLDMAPAQAIGTRAAMTKAGLSTDTKIWFTEIGVFGSVLAERTWLKGLMMVRKLILFAAFPWTHVLLPYFLHSSCVCAKRAVFELPRKSKLNESELHIPSDQILSRVRGPER